MFYITIVSRIVNQKRSEEVLESWITWFSAWDIRTFFLSCWLPAWQFMKHLLEQSHKRFAHLTYFVSSLYLFFLGKLTYKGKESKETIFLVFFIVSRYYGNIHWHNEHIFFQYYVSALSLGNELTIFKFV